jgi:hypothetical protein
VDGRKQVEPRAEGVLRSRIGSTVKQLASASPPTGGKLGDSDDSDEDSEGWGWPLVVALVTYHQATTTMMMLHPVRRTQTTQKW